MATRMPEINFNRQEIANILAPLSVESSIYIAERISSTNDYLQLRLQQTNIPLIVVIAREQSAGRGSYARQWLSAKNHGLYFSFNWQITKQIQPQYLATMAIALVIVAVLNKELNTSAIKLKWPNDIYYNDKKIGGILVENYSGGSDYSNIIIGIGINIFTQNLINSSSLSAICDITAINWNIIIASIIKKSIESLATQDLSDVIMQMWPKFDMLTNKTITVTSFNKIYTGIYQGISPTAELEIEVKGKIVRLLSAKIINFSR